MFQPEIIYFTNDRIYISPNMMKLILSPRNCFQNFRVSRTTTKNLLSITFESNCGAVWPQNGFVHIFGISATFCNSINIKAIARVGGAIVE